jgi:hypothetical protein
MWHTGGGLDIILRESETWMARVVFLLVGLARVMMYLRKEEASETS